MGFRLGDIVPARPAMVRPCWRKQRWTSLGAAEAQLRSLLKQEWLTEDARRRLNAYRCPACEGWHVGRRKVVQEGTP